MKGGVAAGVLTLFVFAAELEELVDVGLAEGLLDYDGVSLGDGQYFLSELLRVCARTSST